MAKMGFRGYVEDLGEQFHLRDTARDHWRYVWNGWKVKEDCILAIDGFPFRLNKMMSKKEFRRHYSSFESCAIAWVDSGYDVLIVPTFYYTDRVMIYTRQ